MPTPLEIARENLINELERRSKVDPDRRDQWKRWRTSQIEKYSNNDSVMGLLPNEYYPLLGSLLNYLAKAGVNTKEHYLNLHTRQDVVSKMSEPELAVCMSIRALILASSVEPQVQEARLQHLQIAERLRVLLQNSAGGSVSRKTQREWERLRVRDYQMYGDDAIRTLFREEHDCGWGIVTRTTKILDRCGIHTRQQLAKLTDEDILKLQMETRGLGKKTADVIILLRDFSSSQIAYRETSSQVINDMDKLALKQIPEPLSSYPDTLEAKQFWRDEIGRRVIREKSGEPKAKASEKRKPEGFLTGYLHSLAKGGRETLRSLIKLPETLAMEDILIMARDAVRSAEVMTVQSFDIGSNLETKQATIENNIEDTRVKKVGKIEISRGILPEEIHRVASTFGTIFESNDNAGMDIDSLLLEDGRDFLKVFVNQSHIEVVIRTEETDRFGSRAEIWLARAYNSILRNFADCDSFYDYVGLVRYAGDITSKELRRVRLPRKSLIRAIWANPVDPNRMGTRSWAL